jgi:hypothetical protein
MMKDMQPMRWCCPFSAIAGHMPNNPNKRPWGQPAICMGQHQWPPLPALLQLQMRQAQPYFHTLSPPLQMDITAQALAPNPSAQNHLLME